MPPPPHDCGLVQVVGHVHVLPQPSLTVPQSATPPAPAHAVVIGIGVHVGWPHTDGVPPPPHVSAPVHVAQAQVPLQPLLTGPQRATPPEVHAVA